MTKKEDKQNIKEQENKAKAEAAEEVKVEETVAEEEQTAENEAEEDAENEQEKMLEEMKEELAKEKDKFIRLYSEFENYRRRTAKEKLELMKTANEKSFSALLTVIDDFERAQANAGNEGVTVESLIEGNTLIYTKLISTLEREGLSLIEVNPGDEFDTEFQEAITQIPSPSPELKGKVVDVVEKGYKLGDKVIRFSKVVIGA